MAPSSPTASPSTNRANPTIGLRAITPSTSSAPNNASDTSSPGPSDPRPTASSSASIDASPTPYAPFDPPTPTPERTSSSLTTNEMPSSTNSPSTTIAPDCDASTTKLLSKPSTISRDTTRKQGPRAKRGVA